VAFDLDKIPRAQLLAEAFPSLQIPDVDREITVLCRLPGCQHRNGQDTSNPSLKIHPRRGSFRCMVNHVEAKGWREFVEYFFGAKRWKTIRDACMGGERSAEELAGEWDRLKPERAWTERYRITPELSRTYLRGGDRRAKGDPVSETIVGAWSAGKLLGLKFRRPGDQPWAEPTPNDQTRTGKYRWRWKDKAAKDLVLLADRARPGAAIVFCAGEKDALVAASHLDPARWAPVTGVDGEASVPKGARLVCTGRDVVIAYDGDAAGRHGAWELARALERVAVSVRAIAWPDEAPPKGEERWDVAGWIGAGRSLELLLEDAIAVPPAWQPPKVKGPGQAPPPDEPHDGLEVKHPLDAWREVGGRLARGRETRDGVRWEVRFDGTIRVARVETTWLEDPDAVGGWAEQKRVTYRFAFAGGRVLERVAEPGKRAFLELVDEQLGAALSCYTTTERAMLFQWVQRTAAEAQHVEVRQALGPHGELGWLAAPGVAVRGGRVEEASCAVAAPGELHDLRRYRLTAIADEDLRRVGPWIVERLLRCDHVDMAYTLPLLGMILSAPLWHYLPTLSSWQRYAGFLQGPSGVGKSQLVRYLMSFWGDFRDPEGLTTWLSSSTFVEDLVHQAVGVPVFVADWKRSQFNADAYRAAMGLLQAYADRSSRGRADARGRAQRRRPPRCTLLIDGEDLPEGQQATLGRLLVLDVQAQGDTQRCASANDEVLDPELLALLPGVTARWIAWVQRSGQQLGEDLRAALAHMDDMLPSGSTNRSRLVRNYGVQLTTIAGFLRFLETEAGARGARERVFPRALTVHADLATKQLCRVADEAAAELFLNTLRALLSSGEVYLRPESDQAGENPFQTTRGGSCVGTYDREGDALVWPDMAVPIVNAHMTRGGGGRIEFTADAIRQQLVQDGVIEDSPRVRRSDDRLARVRAWRMRLEALGALPREQDQQDWTTGAEH
jgi:hypothetical protein